MKRTLGDSTQMTRVNTILLEKLREISRSRCETLRTVVERVIKRGIGYEERIQIFSGEEKNPGD